MYLLLRTGEWLFRVGVHLWMCFWWHRSNSSTDLWLLKRNKKSQCKKLVIKLDMLQKYVDVRLFDCLLQSQQRVIADSTYFFKFVLFTTKYLKSRKVNVLFIYSQLKQNGGQNNVSLSKMGHVVAFSWLSRTAPSSFRIAMIFIFHYT